MALLTIQEVSKLGATLAQAAAAAAGDSFLNDGNCILLINNTDAAPITATIATPGKVAGVVDIDEVVVTVPAAGQAIAGLFPPQRYNDATGRVVVTYSAVTDVFVSVVRV